MAAIILTAALSSAPGLVIGILALILPAHGCELRKRRIMASIGISLSLLGFMSVFLVMQAINSIIRG